MKLKTPLVGTLAAVLMLTLGATTAQARYVTVYGPITQPRGPCITATLVNGLIVQRVVPCQATRRACVYRRAHGRIVQFLGCHSVVVKTAPRLVVPLA